MPRNIKLDDGTYSMLKELKYALRKDTFSQVIRALIEMSKGAELPKVKLPYPESILASLPDAMEFFSEFVEIVDEILTDLQRASLSAKLSKLGVEKASAAQYVLAFFQALREGASQDEALKRAEEIRNEVYAKIKEKTEGRKEEPKEESEPEEGINFEELVSLFEEAHEKAKSKAEKEFYSYLHDAALLRSTNSICRLYESAKKRGLRIDERVEAVLQRICEEVSLGAG